jgi:hypothetical protein
MVTYLNILLITLLLLAQIGVAQHSAVHSDHHDCGHAEHHHGEHDHDAPEKAQDKCDVCLSIQSMAFGLITDKSEVEIPYLISQNSSLMLDITYASKDHTPYLSRAPPAIFF